MVSRERRKIYYFQKYILKWFLTNGRNFYWRIHFLKPWEWLLLEQLLKKTKAETVDMYYEDIVKKYASPHDVLLVDLDILQNDLKKLGLYKQRSIALKKISGYLETNYNGIVPVDLQLLYNIPYVGVYSANAIWCFGYGKKVPIVDVNSARIISRFFGITIPKDLRNMPFIEYCSKLVPNENFIAYNYGLLDFGASICKSKPMCKICDIQNKCTYYISKLIA